MTDRERIEAYMDQVRLALTLNEEELEPLLQRRKDLQNKLGAAWLDLYRIDRESA